MDDIMQMIQMAMKQSPGNTKEQAKILAAFGAPPENFEPKIALPVQNDLPSFSVKQPGIGGELSGQNHGVAAPVLGNMPDEVPSIGQLLIGDADAAH